MEPKPSCSKPVKGINSPREKRQKRTYFSTNEKNMVVNVYKYVKETWPANEYPYKTSINEKTAAILGIGVASVYRILKEYATDHRMKSPTRTKKRPKLSEKIEPYKEAIRNKIHSFFMKGEVPTLKNVLQAVNEDKELPNYKRSTFQKILKHLKFQNIKRHRHSTLNDFQLAADKQESCGNHVMKVENNFE